MSSPNPVGPNDPRGNAAELIADGDAVEEVKPDELEAEIGPNDPRGNRSNVATSSAD